MIRYRILGNYNGERVIAKHDILRLDEAEALREKWLTIPMWWVISDGLKKVTLDDVEIVAGEVIWERGLLNGQPVEDDRQAAAVSGDDERAAVAAVPA